jgi:cytoskeleton protein RodZ
MSEDPQELGRRLKAERERRGLSTQKIANGMRLDEWVIEALEAGDYQRIGPAVYARGHLKKYASLLGISPASPDGDAVPPASRMAAAGPTPIVRLEAPKETHPLWPRLGTAATAAILAGGIFWWRGTHQGSGVPVVPARLPPPADASTRATPEVAAASPGESGELAAAAPVVPAKPASPPAMPPASAPGAPSTSGAAELTPGVGRARLRLSFSADSWVDIRDYSGKRVFEGNGRANSVKSVAGMAPFRIYLRSASGVQLELNDRAVAIGRQFISGDEARFEAGADGVLRRESRAAPPGNDPQTAAVSPHG